MNNIDNWTEVTRGLYRYVVASKVCYEIHIMYHDKDTDILTATASLYVVGEWRNILSGKSFFERECILLEEPVFECLAAAVKDDEENNQ